MRMKIGILTFHYAHNYGAMLQAYALCTKLRFLGYDAKIIDYRLEAIYISYEKVSFFRLYRFHCRKNGRLKALLKAVKYFKGHWLKDEKWGCFEDFLTNTLVKTDRVYDVEAINRLGLDAVICGSDQIWNDKLTDGVFAPVYFCDKLNPDIRRISYAASNGGSGVADDKVDLFKQLCANFNRISVREEGLSSFMKGIGIPNTLVLDPIFLLDKVEWGKVAVAPVEADYVLTYSFSESPGFFDFALSVARFYKKKLVCFVYNRRKELPEEVIQYTNGGPMEFLGYFKNAAFVVTNSFHGTAFSVLFQKQFLNIPPLKGRERTDSLLQSLQLTDRIVEDGQRVRLDELATVDYRPVMEILEQRKSDSIDFLKNALN